ncbi:MAG: hypothetical protein Q4C91_04220 [Eubacteriales bacterium]|nr:hypothetical protein [Eubacteriales bacterium]
MEHTFFQYNNSLTKQAEASAHEWAMELSKMSDWLMDESPVTIVEYLNKKENLCTPGYLMRRQIQEKFHEMLEQAVNTSRTEYKDLFICGNVAWSEGLISELSKLLSKEEFSKSGKRIKASEWEKWLSDMQIPSKRELAIRISFALEMDDLTTTKFLLACGHEDLSVRSPLDYICLFCRQSASLKKWEKVEELLKKYECRCHENTTAETYVVPRLGMTQLMTNNLSELAAVPESRMEENLLEYMCSLEHEFVHKSKSSNQYLAGYSLQRRADLLEWFRYFVRLYPYYEAYKYRVGDVWRKRVEIDENGIPNLRSLTRAMLDSHNWESVDYEDIGLEPKSKRKSTHDRSPFNKEVYLFFKEYEKHNRLKTIDRILDSPENAVPVERKDILLLSYFFISGFLQADEEIREELYRMTEENPQGNRFTFILKDVIGQLADIADGMNEEDNDKAYIQCINQLLEAFSFEGFYPPFIMDRFVLLALMGEEIGGFESLSACMLRDGYSHMEAEE